VESAMTSRLGMVTLGPSRAPPAPSLLDVPASGSSIPTVAMQSIPDARQQSFEELYGPPENFLEIEVRAAQPPPTSLTTQPYSPCRVRRSATQ
jgi:hypothetical protein